jgi:hypothetical protein
MHVIILLLALLALKPNALASTSPNGKRKGKITVRGDRHCDWDPCADISKIWGGDDTCCAVVDYDFNITRQGWREIKTHSQTLYQPLTVSSGNLDYKDTAEYVNSVSARVMKKYIGAGGVENLEWETTIDPSFYAFWEKDAEQDAIGKALAQQIFAQILITAGVDPYTAQTIAAQA